MAKEKTLTLWADIAPQQDTHDWTFNGASTRELTHCYHDYPARMIPQIAGKLLDTFAPKANILFDPYCGSGTSLVEGMVRGINVIGTDLNPLARLVARAKTSPPNIAQIDGLLSQFYQFLCTQHTEHDIPLKIAGISRLDFWFKPEVLSKLSKIKSFIDKIEDELSKLFFKVAFSETVRESSNTRNEEFKLYRYEVGRLEKFNPDVFGIMLAKLNRNRSGLVTFLSVLEAKRGTPTAKVYDFNTVVGIPDDKVPASSVDIVVTSPPYGDSHTTVAYGQYSRLSSAWLGLSNPEKVDGKLMGGKASKLMPRLPSPPLEEALNIIKKNDQKRALEVAAFYADLFKSITHVGKLLRVGGHACYVVGNRRVKGVTLPTDDAVRHFFEQVGFQYVDTFHRSIPNKRMPLRNSPTNAPGAVDSTMTREYIVVMHKG
jgi:site-specific DNA-methyltransferase (cytosine-N4-specific)